MLGLVVAWFLLSLGVAAAFHWTRSRYRPVSVPRAVQQFLRRFEDELSQHHPAVSIHGMIPGRFSAVLRIRGQETPVALQPLFRRTLAFPDSFSDAVSQFVDEIETHGIDRIADHQLQDYAGAILPQIRTRAWIEEHSMQFGIGMLVHRQFTDELVICYVIDEPRVMTFVCMAHLCQWGMSEEDLFHLATHNLHRRAAGELPVPSPDEPPVLVNTGDGFDAARVLLLEAERLDGLLVALPERDALWLGNEPGQDLAELMRQTAAQSKQSEHPLSPHLFRFHKGQLVPVTTESSEPLSAAPQEPGT